MIQEAMMQGGNEAEYILHADHALFQKKRQ